MKKSILVSAIFFSISLLCSSCAKTINLSQYGNVSNTCLKAIKKGRKLKIENNKEFGWSVYEIPGVSSNDWLYVIHESLLLSTDINLYENKQCGINPLSDWKITNITVHSERQELIFEAKEESIINSFINFKQSNKKCVEEMVVPNFYYMQIHFKETENIIWEAKIYNFNGSFVIRVPEWYQKDEISEYYLVNEEWQDLLIKNIK